MLTTCASSVRRADESRGIDDATDPLVINVRPNPRRRNRRASGSYLRCEFVTVYGAGFLMVIAVILIALRPAITVAEWIGRVLGK